MPSARHRPHAVCPLPSKPPTLARQVARCARRLEQAGAVFGHGTDNAFDEAVWLACGAAGIAPDDFERRREQPLDAPRAAAIEALLERRIVSRIPTAYLLNEAWFAGRPYYVDERVLIPRSPLGEWISDGLRPWLASAPRTILDLGAGSGCIGIALALVFEQARVVLSDLSGDALAVAAINARRHEVEDRTTIIRGDLFGALAGRRFDLVVSNPPYVNDAAMAALPREYRHEPAAALAGGGDGLDCIVPLLEQAPAHLEERGVLLVEAGSARAALERRYPRTPFTWLLSASGAETVFLLQAAELPAAGPTP